MIDNYKIYIYINMLYKMINPQKNKKNKRKWRLTK